MQTFRLMLTDGIEPIGHRWIDRLGKRKNLTPASLTTYRSVLRNFTRWNGGNPVLYLDAEHVGAWVDHLASTGIDPSTRRTYLGVLGQFYSWCVLEGLRPDNPCSSVDRPRGRRRLPRPMPEQEYAKALQLADADMKVILGLAGFAGLRAMEVAGLRWQDIDLNCARPSLGVRGKGGHERVVDISPELEEMLRALPHRTGPVIRRLDGSPGPNTPFTISHRASAYLRGVGIEGRGLHSLRHRFATMVYLRTKDLRAVQEACGHAEPGTSALYAMVARTAVRDAVLAAGHIDLTV